MTSPGRQEADALGELRRLAIAGVLLAIAIAVPSTFAFGAAFGGNYDAFLSTGSDLGAIVAGGHSAAVLLRWGAFGDMLYSYVLLIPLALYLRSSLRDRKPWLADLGLLAGYAYIVVGAAGAASLAFGGPPLIDAYAAALPPERVAILASFTSLRDVVIFGLWQTLDPITLGVWIASVGWLIRPDRRAVGGLLTAIGLGTVSVSLLTTLGIPGFTKIALGLGLPSLIFAVWLMTDRSAGRARSIGRR